MTKRPAADNATSRPGREDISDAAKVIRAGGLVAMPTETVYGLAADATNDKAVARIFAAKGRPSFNPLIVHVAGLEMAKRYAAFSPLAEKLAQAFWPGPLTLVLPRCDAAGISLLVSAGLNTIALRAPASPLAQSLIEAAGRPLAAPSANRSGSVSPTTAAHVAEGLGDKVDLILDGGPAPVGVESTIVKVDGEGVLMLRPGGVARAALERFLGRAVPNAPLTDKPQAPGMLASHYAPQARLRLNAKAPAENEAYLSFGEGRPASALTLNLSPGGDVNEAAANLFAYLRRLDTLCAEEGLEGVAVAPIPMDGLGEAINDRLARAAAPKH